MNFRERLEQVIRRKKSLLCVGLDTDIAKLPAALQKSDDPLFEFNKAIIDATAEFAAAFKVNLAFYEAHGLDGWRALEKTFAYLPDDVVKIADAKRGDIGNTAQMYAKALFDGLGADAVTVNPYMGYDSAAPFLPREDHGAFFLCLTSNPGAKDFQYFPDGDMPLFQKVAQTVAAWNGRGNCGLVVGATHPQELAAVRQLAPDLPLLIPGIGAQGGNLEASVVAAGGLAFFNSSRAVIYASSGEDFAPAAARAARLTRDQLNSARN